MFKCILSGTYFCPNSIKIENQAVSTKKVTKKEEPEFLVYSSIYSYCVNYARAEVELKSTQDGWEPCQ